MTRATALELILRQDLNATLVASDRLTAADYRAMADLLDQVRREDRAVPR